MDPAQSIPSVVAYDAQQGHWLWFRDPVQVLVAWEPAAVLSVLQALEQATQGDRPLYAAGFVAYEAAPAFDAAFVVRPDGAFPLAWFGLYREPVVLPPDLGGAIADTTALSPSLGWQRSLSETAYRAAIAQVKQQIQRGDTYQVNYSFRLRAPFVGDPWDLFRRMIEAQGNGYGAFVLTEDWAICSASPELFFEQQGPVLQSRPMKGTAPRALSAAADAQQAAGLRQSHKDNAENLMIVDMVRNDLGRVATLGTVTVPHLFAVEKYPTLWQLTSTVRCQTEAGLVETFGALFPAASITGAPKARTMEIIAELETAPRRIYTGSIGFVLAAQAGGAPRSQFNVAIRTVLIDRQHQQAEYGVGGGVVWDSQPGAEFQECATKARVLTHTLPPFDLLESLRWTPEEGYALLELHLQRLVASADYFSRPLDRQAVEQALEDWAAAALITTPRPHKVRVQVSREGAIALQSHPLIPLPQPYRLPLAAQPIASDDLFLYHKTTHRRVYEAAIAQAPGFPDVLLWNERGEVTESCLGNVVIERDGQWLTPPVSCGLLPGTYRESLLAQGQIREAVIHTTDLPHASRLFLINSVRGRWEVTYLSQGAPAPMGC